MKVELTENYLHIGRHMIAPLIYDAYSKAGKVVLFLNDAPIEVLKSEAEIERWLNAQPWSR